MVDENIVELLLVEDSREDAELTLRALKKMNLTNNVRVLVDGEDALDFIFSKGKYSDRINAVNPRLILLDLKLPKVDGLEVLKKIKSDEAKKLIPIVVLTSSSEEAATTSWATVLASKPAFSLSLENSTGSFGYTTFLGLYLK